ncbi:hypothetical protein D3C75_1273810 [compost metagenome]
MGRLEDILSLLARLSLERVLPMSRLIELEAESGSTDKDYLIISCHRGAELQQAAEQLRLSGNGVEWLEIPGEGRDSA